MTATIQAANQNALLSIDAALKLEKLQSLENSTGELDKKNGLEKKKRPEEMADSLAALASAIWIRQPDDIKAQVNIKFELNTEFNSFSTQNLCQVFAQQNEADLESNQNFQLGSTSGYTGNDISKSSPLSFVDSSTKSIDSFKSDEVAKPEHEYVPATVSSELQVSSTSAASMTSTGSWGKALAFREQSFYQSSQNPDLRVTSTNSAVKQSPAPEDRSSTDGDRSGPTETLSKPDLRRIDDRSDSVDFESDHKSKSEEVLDAAWTVPVTQQQFASPELVPDTSPQQFGNNLKRSAEHARAQLSAQKGSVEGVKYSFNSWGGSDNSVQITGSSRSGYKAQASNSVVGSILEKHLSDDDALGLTVESRACIGNSEDLNNQLVEKVDQNNL